MGDFYTDSIDIAVYTIFPALVKSDQSYLPLVDTLSALAFLLLAAAGLLSYLYWKLLKSKASNGVQPKKRKKNPR